jgi:hypothetical protein
VGLTWACAEFNRGSDGGSISDEFIIALGEPLDGDVVTVDDFLIVAMMLGGRHV